jgi:hypothetical protein
MMNKKSIEFLGPILPLALLIILLPAAFITINTKHKEFEKPPGETSFAMLRTYEKGELVLLYIDKSAELALKDAVYDLGNNAFYCGDDYNGFNVLASKAKQCFIDEAAIRQKIIDRFRERFDYYLKSYPDLSLPRSYAYQFTLNNKDNNVELVGETNEKIVIDITESPSLKNEVDQVGNYQINPSFRVNINFNLNFFIEKMIKAKKLYGEFLSNSILDENDATHYVSSNSPGFTVGYCDTFSDEDNKCINDGKIPVYDMGKVTSCYSCNNLFVALAACKRYYNDDFCNRDLCSKNCIWDGEECVKKIDADNNIIRLCTKSDFWMNSYNERLGVYETRPVVLKFAFDLG